MSPKNHLRIKSFPKESALLQENASPAPIDIGIEKLPAAIRFHRKKSGLTQKDLARLAGLGKAVIFDIEKGKKTVQLDTLIKVLTILNIKMNFSSSIMDRFLDLNA